MEENLVWEQPNNYFSAKNVNEYCTDSDSEELNEKRTSWCLDNNDDEQQLRQELIQRATTRLRRRLLEQGLQDVMTQVVSLQTQLESLRLDAITTIDTISDIFDDNKNEKSSVKMNRQMDVLERRLSLHKSSLEQFTITPDHHDHDDHLLSKKDQQPTPLTAMAMSRLSSLSLVSSIFGRTSDCTSDTSISDRQSIIDDDCISHIESIGGEDHPFYDLAGKRSFKEGSFCGSVYSEQEQGEQPNIPCNTSEIRWRRRQRRQRHQQYLEQQKKHSYSDDNESFISDDISSFGNNKPNALIHPLSCSPMTPPPNYHAGNYFFKSTAAAEQEFDYNKDKTQSWLYANNSHLNENIYPQRNVLDEAMSFLDSISENGDDMGFGEDFYLLLRNPDLCCRPLSEIQTTMQELRQQQQLQYLNPTHWCKMGMDVVYKTTCTSLQWCKFLSVLSAAVVISIMKGPEDVRRHSF